MSGRRDPRSRAPASAASDPRKRRRTDEDPSTSTSTLTTTKNTNIPSQRPPSALLYAVICASNMNRSMQGHHVLSSLNFRVRSYGTGSAVRLPGPSIDRPNVYAFGTEYEAIWKDLVSKDRELYVQNGVLGMLERNIKTKRAPESWQDCREIFNVIFTCEERCFDAVVEELLDRGESLHIPVHIINLEIRDNAEDALVGGNLFVELATMIEESKDYESDMTQILETFQQRTKANIMHCVCYF